MRVGRGEASRKVRNRRTVDVGSTAGIVTGEDSLELDNTVGVGLLETTEEGRVDVALVIAVAVSAGDDARVDTLVFSFVSVWVFLLGVVVVVARKRLQWRCSARNPGRPGERARRCWCQSAGCPGRGEHPPGPQRCCCGSARQRRLLMLDRVG